MDNQQETKKQLDSVLEWYQQELKGIRTGRVNPQIIEDLEISYYDQLTPIKQAANVSVSDARTIVISPWSKDSLIEIEKAIRESDLGINPINDGEIIRVTFPPLTEEKRKDIVKIVKQKTEEARVKIRKIREEKREQILAKKKNGEIGEDEAKREEKELQEMIDEYNRQIDEVYRKKEKEVLTV